MMAPPEASAWEPIARKPTPFAEWCYQRKQLWPSMFLCMVGTLATPTMVLGVRIGTDPTARYWLGSSVSHVIAIPFLIVVCFLLHLVARRPRFWPTLCSTVVPALIVIFVGLFTFWPTGSVGHMLLAQDCTSYPKKFELDVAYRGAAALFDSCVQRVAATTNSTVNATVPLIDINDCSEFLSAAAGDGQYVTQWAYLKATEELYGCSGWCTPGEPSLWSRTHYAYDLCTQAAGSVIKDKIWRLGQYMMWIGIVQLVVSVWAVQILSNMMFTNGVEW